MRRGVERDALKVGDVTNHVHALRTSVLTGHDIPAQVDGDGVRAIHPAFLAKGLGGPAALDRGVELIDALAEAEAFGSPTST